MKRNVEIKARVSDLATMSRLAESISDSGPTVIEQEDTFFHTSRGRLKLRKFSASEGEIIYYERGDAEDPAECRYMLAATSEPTTLVEILSSSLEVRGIVRKTRTLYIAGQTRIHLDEVEGLGSFVELEVVLRPDQSTEDGTGIANDLMGQLGIGKSDLVAKAYIDLLEEGAR